MIEEDAPVIILVIILSLRTISILVEELDDPVVELVMCIRVRKKEALESEEVVGGCL